MNTCTQCVLALLALVLPGALTAADQADPAQQEFILSAEEPGNEDTYTNAEIVPVPNGGTVFALRQDDTGPLSYSFSLTAVNLVDFLGTLSQTLYDEHDTASTIAHGERLTVWDVGAREHYIDVKADKLSLAAVLDLASLASNCNIFVENRTIIVDRCDN